jgi:hypothetical protein
MFGGGGQTRTVDSADMSREPATKTIENMEGFFLDAIAGCD